MVTNLKSSKVSKDQQRKDCVSQSSDREILHSTCHLLEST